MSQRIWLMAAVGVVLTAGLVEAAPVMTMAEVDKLCPPRPETAAKYEPGTYPAAARPYRESALAVYHYMTVLPAMTALVEKGKPHQKYQHNAYVSKTHAAHIGAMLSWALAEPECRETAMRFARASAEFLLGELEPETAPLAWWPPTYGRKPLEFDPKTDGPYRKRAMIGNEPEGAVKYRGEVMLVYPASVGMAFLKYYSATRDQRFLTAAIGIGETYLRIRRPDGSWPLKMKLATAEVVGENLLVPDQLLGFFESLFEATKVERWQAAEQSVLAWLEAHPLADWNWDGQFEDIKPKRPYQNPTKHNAIATMMYLQRHFPKDPARLATCRQLLEFCEKRFVVWKAPANHPNWPAPSVLEQYSCFTPIDSSVAKMIKGYLAIYRAEGRAEDLEKAQALGNMLTRMQKPSGRIPTFWEGVNTGDSGLSQEQYDWLNCMSSSAAALLELAAIAPRAQGNAEGWVEDFSRAENWEIGAYENRVKFDFTIGEGCLLKRSPEAKGGDTAWMLTSKPIAVTPGARSYRVRLVCRANCYYAVQGSPSTYYPRVHYLRADGSKLGAAVMSYRILPGDSEVLLTGPIPADVAKVQFSLGADQPEITTATELNFRRMEVSFGAAEIPTPECRVRRNYAGLHEVRLRDDGMTLVDGKPFFPIGVYGLSKQEFNGNNWDRMFEQLGELGFNFGQSYQAKHDPSLMEAAERHGFKLMIHADQPDAQFWRDWRQPAILAWYVGDDTSMHFTPAQLLAKHAAIKLSDPKRITTQADVWGYDAAGSHYRDFVRASDNFQPELYPIHFNTAEESSNCVACIVRDMRGAFADIARSNCNQPKSVWPLVQYFQGWGWQRFPTADELTAMSFAAITEGGQGILWYTYGRNFDRDHKRWNHGLTASPENWETMRKVSTWIAELAPILVERTPPQPVPPEIVSGPQSAPMGVPTLSYLLKEHNGRQYLLTVNCTKEEVRAKFRLKGLVRVSKAHVQRESRILKLDVGTLTDAWSPFAVHVYEF